MPTLLERLRATLHLPGKPHSPRAPRALPSMTRQAAARDEDLAEARDEFRRQLAALQDAMNPGKGPRHGRNGSGH